MDKTRNMYLMEKSKFEKLVVENVSKKYTKSTNRSVTVSDNKSAKIAEELELEDIMTRHTTNNCYVTEGYKSRILEQITM